MKTVCESFNKIVSLCYEKFNNNKNEDGVSLLDLIIAMAVMLVLTVSTSSIYNVVSNNAREAAVDKAVNDVLKGAMVFYSDGLEDTQPEDARDQWMNSRGSKSQVSVDLKIEDNEIIVTGSYAGKNISTTRSANPYGSTCIDGIYVGGSKTGQPCVTGEEDSEVPGPIISDVISRLTYKCDTTTSGYLAATGIEPGTKITMAGSDATHKMIKYSSQSYHDLFYSPVYTSTITDKVTMKKGVKYSVVINGKFDKLQTPRELGGETADDTLAQCLVSVDKLGKDSGITMLSAFGGKKLTGMPDSIPATVTSLKTAFRGATIFNDPNVSKWDVSNVTSLNYTFGTAKEFNQPLNDWNVSNVTDMYATFFSNSFDQPLDKWDTGKVTTLNQTFASNKSFSHSLNNWDVSNVTNMLSTFRYANSFDKPLDKWDTGKVTNMNTTFSYNSGFDQNISKWNVDKVAYYKDFALGGKLSENNIPAKFKN